MYHQLSVEVDFIYFHSSIHMTLKQKYAQYSKVTYVSSWGTLTSASVMLSNTEAEVC